MITLIKEKSLLKFKNKSIHTQIFFDYCQLNTDVSYLYLWLQNLDNPQLQQFCSEDVELSYFFDSNNKTPDCHVSEVTSNSTNNSKNSSSNNSNRRENKRSLEIEMQDYFNTKKQTSLQSLQEIRIRSSNVGPREKTDYEIANESIPVLLNTIISFSNILKDMNPDDSMYGWYCEKRTEAQHRYDEVTKHWGSK